MKQRGSPAPHENFWHCETKPFELKIGISLSYAYNYSTVMSFWNTEGFHYKFFRPCKTKRFWQENVIPPPTSYKIFSIPEVFWNTKCFLMKIFGTVRLESSDRKTKYPQPTSPYFFAYRKISEAQKGSSPSFWHYATKKLRRENVIPPSSPYTFSITEVFWNTKLFPRKVFDTGRLKLFDGKSWSPSIMH